MSDYSDRNVLEHVVVTDLVQSLNSMIELDIKGIRRDDDFEEVLKSLLTVIRYYTTEEQFAALSIKELPEDLKHYFWLGEDAEG